MTNYPDEIYCNDYNIGEIHAAERAYEICKKHAQEATTETEWFNLTEQIAAGANIDWEKLDGCKAKCIHETMGEIMHELTRNDKRNEQSVDGWCKTQMDGWHLILPFGWSGYGGWTLWIDRPVPLKRKTADQLEPGTCIRTTEGVLGMVYEDASGIKGFWGANQTVKLADEVEVHTEYGIGTFKAVDNEA